MNRSRLLAAAALCAASTTALAETFTVYVFSREFSQNIPDGGGTLPDDPTIHVGDTVHWIDFEGFHTTHSCGGMTESWDSNFMMDGDTYDHTFTHAGVFGYYCAFHGIDNGNGTADGMAGVITVLDAPPSCPADLGIQGGGPGHDGILDNNDFIAFIDFFFNHNAAADVGVQGGIAGHDSTWDNNDFVVFINLFFAGCGN
jgi:plastocyanin